MMPITLLQLLPFVAAMCCLALAIVSVVRRPSTATRAWFFAGMTTLAVDSVFTGLALRAASPAALVASVTLAFISKSFLPLFWLGFSLTYSRGSHPGGLSRWRTLLAIAALPLMALPLGVSGHLLQVAVDAEKNVWHVQFAVAGRMLNVVLLVAFVLILMNLEQTFRAAVGTMRWRIKFVVLAVAVIFGSRLYVRTQAILFSAPDVAFWGVESTALLIGCAFLTLAYIRTGWAEIDVYPSRAVLRSSLTVVIVGVYLFAVGVLAQVVRFLGRTEIFQFQAVVVLLGVVGLAVLLLSDRARQRVHGFVGRHFSKAQHDSVRIWTLFSQRLTGVKDRAALCEVSARLISETFEVLSVHVWLADAERSRLQLELSTAQARTLPTASGAITAAESVLNGLRDRLQPFDLDDVTDDWAVELRQLNPSEFNNGGHRLCVPLCAGGQISGVVVLGDRVNGATYTIEELELLECIGDHVTSVLLNLQLAGEVARARELQAFQTMSAFFVHDLKNAASSLNLMLENLPVHFDDPAFRSDALRAIANTAKRIDDMIVRLTALRQGRDLTRVESDLNRVVSEALERVNGMPDVELTTALQPLPTILADTDQLQSVVTNLVLNAREALASGGRIEVRTEHRNGRVVLSVADNGCGMSPAFIRSSLFRPFQSTKRKGLGIGLFQSQAIVHAHGGGMHVESEVGKGTTFHVSLPAGQAK
jgi:putative PEP-CTERM system histidine kinase